MIQNSQIFKFKYAYYIPELTPLGKNKAHCHF